MVFPQGWDRRDQWTLRFADPELERAYQRADHPEGVRRARTASLTAIGVWIVVGVLGPPTIEVDAGRTWLVSIVMVVVSLASSAAIQSATTRRRLDAIGIGQQLAACVAALTLCWITGIFATYAMPAVMLIGIFGFSITRPSFRGSIALGVAYSALFVASSIAYGTGRPLLLQASLVIAAMVAAGIGAYVLEASQRAVFAQSRLVSALRDRVDLLLHQYLSPEVASSLISDPERAALGGTEVEVTVLFADLRGYTAYAEHRRPAEVVEHLNAAYGAVVPILLDEGGTVVGFMGDAVMAVFNAPTPQPDHALRASRAALAMQQAVRDLDPTSTAPKFRVGVNSGPALIGNIGAAQVRNFSAIGDATNLAARLQTFAPEGSVVIGESTYRLIRAQAVVRSLGTPELKGKAELTEVYELLALREV